jgi:adenosylmethionine-8-amino-7-oxononanoate aminotransferase
MGDGKMSGRAFTEQDYLSSDNLRRMVLDFVQMGHFMQKPLVFNRSDSIWLWDVKGDKYLDGISGVWVMNLGHNNRRIIDAMKKQLDEMVFCSPILSTNSRAFELVKKLGKHTPEGLTTIKLLSGGSEATETAIKLVRQYFKQTGRPYKNIIISRYLNFHGVTLGALTATGINNRKWMFEPLTGGFRHIAPPYCLRCPYDLRYPECDVVCATILERIIEYEGPDNVAGFMGEPIQLSTGNIVPPPEYWPIIRRICDKYDVMIISDEIATGFGRTGKMWGADTFSTVPDVLCMGKGMSGGYAPLAGVAFRDEVAEVFISDDRSQAFADGHTYGGNPISSAAGIAALDVIVEEDLVQRSYEMGAYLREKLIELQEFGIVAEIRGKGLMIGVEFVENLESMQAFPPELEFGIRIGKNCIHKQHVLIRYAHNWIAVAPPFTITKEEIDYFVKKIAQAISDTLEEIRQ